MPIPALAMTTSMLPNRATPSSITALICARSRTSACPATIWPPAFSTSSTVSSRSSCVAWENGTVG
jgi:hypothetical protein